MAAVSISFLLACPTALSQTVLYTFDGDSAGDNFGYSVSGAGDVNGDGVPDLIVGAWKDDNGGLDSGSARVFSGIDGSVLYTFDGDSAGDIFGVAVSGAGDVNADGFDDLIVGASRGDGNGPFSGSARVFSGVDGSVLYTFDGGSAGDNFGTAVSGAGDVNSDGFDDLIVGAPRDDDNGPDSGSARVFSGADGSVLYTFDGDSQLDELGRSVSGAGDVNADGFDDLIVGAWKADDNGVDSGSARVFSGADGSALYTFVGDSAGDVFGWAVSAAGDVNADGFDDLIVAAKRDDDNGLDSGSARVFSGVDGSVLYSFYGDSELDDFGWSVSGAGDVNADGFDDLIVGAWHDDNNGPCSGSPRVFSGADGSVLYTLDGEAAGDHLGTSVSGAGDVDLDGFDDLIVGSYGDDDNGLDSGSARVLLGRGALGSSYCGPAVANSTGRPGVIRSLGLDDASANEVFLTAQQLPNGEFGYFLTSQTQGLFMPPGSQGNICLGGNIGRFNQPGNVGEGPTFSIQVDLTSIPLTPPRAVQPGDTWNFQCWYRDVGNRNNFTDAVSVSFY